MPIDWAPFVELVRRRQRFVLTTHVRPDGDGLGSMLALADALEQRGKSVQMVVASSLPPRYDFLDPEMRVGRFPPPGAALPPVDAAVVLDTGTWNQLGDFGPFLRSLAVEKAVIDHHLTQDDLGAVRFVDTTAEATGRLVYEVVMALGGPLSERSAHRLFVALAMDTGWFRHPNTTPATFRLAAELEQAGANPTAAYEALFEQSTPGRLRLTGLVLGRLRTENGGRVCYTEIHKGDYAAAGAVPQDSEDLVNYPRGVVGVEVGLLLMEQPQGGVKVSLRSRQVDVARVAEQFGGGGHRLAAGAVLDTTLDEARRRVLAAVERAMEPPA